MSSQEFPEFSFSLLSRLGRSDSLVEPVEAPDELERQIWITLLILFSCSGLVWIKAAGPCGQVVIDSLSQVGFS